MQINMTTFAGRSRHYIHDSLQSLLASDWAETQALLNLIVGSEDESHVQQYAGHPSIRIIPWDAEPLESMRLNCTLNKIRALRCGDDNTTLTCEDDVRFPPHWFAALQQAAAELAGEKYILSLFAARDLLAKAPLVAGKLWIKQYPTETLQGAQALFYPTKSLRDGAVDYLRENLRKGCGDDLIGRYARAEAALYATKDPLVRNIGQVSCFHS